MAMLRSLFAAQKNGGDFEQSPVQIPLDFALAHERQELVLILSPLALAFLVSIEHLLGGSEQRDVNVFRLTDLPKKKCEIVSFGETSQLRGIVQANVEEPANAGCSEGFKEFPRRFLGKTDGIDFHVSCCANSCCSNRPN
jgi:hypothetical protein